MPLSVKANLVVIVLAATTASLAGAEDLGGDKAMTEAGAIPAKLFEKTRPMVTAGLANEVRGREPIRRPDVGPDRGGGQRCPPGPRQREDKDDQSGGRDHLTEQDPGGGAVVDRDLNRG